MTLTFSGTGSDGTDQYSVSGSVSEGSVSLSYYKVEKPQEEVKPDVEVAVEDDPLAHTAAQENNG